MLSLLWLDFEVQNQYQRLSKHEYDLDLRKSGALEMFVLSIDPLSHHVQPDLLTVLVQNAAVVC